VYIILWFAWNKWNLNELNFKISEIALSNDKSSLTNDQQITFQKILQSVRNENEPLGLSLSIKM